MYYQPEDVILATVRLAPKPVAILLAEIETKYAQPHVLVY
jgi:hypothetical protein